MISTNFVEHRAEKDNLDRLLIELRREDEKKRITIESMKEQIEGTKPTDEIELRNKYEQIKNNYRVSITMPLLVFPSDADLMRCGDK